MFKFQFIGVVNYVHVDITVFANARKEALEKARNALETNYTFNDSKIIISEVEARDPSEIAKAKAEAIKEFAERFCDECLECPLEDGDLTILVDRRKFDNLVKEMTEDAGA